MQKKHPRRGVDMDVEIEMTPMIDVTFQLLIFFIVTMKFRLLEKKLDSHLPLNWGQKASQTIDEISMTVTLSQDPESRGRLIERSTRYAIEGRTVALDDVRAQLARFREAYPDARLRLDVRTGVPHARVVELLDLGQSLGYIDMGYAGLPRFRSDAARNTWWNRTRRDLAR